MFEENALNTGINQGGTPEQLEVATPELGSSPQAPQGYERFATPRGSMSTLRQSDYDFNISQGDAVFGAFRQMDTANIARGLYYDFAMDRLNKFGEADPEFSLEQAIKAEGISLTKNEMERLTKSRPDNQASFDYFIEDIQNTRDDSRAMSQSPVTSFTVGMFDPVYAVGGGIGATIGKGLKAGRVGSGVIAGSSDTGVALVASYYNPDMTATDIVANALFGFGFGAVFGGRPKEVPETPSIAVRPVTGDIRAPKAVDGDLLAELRANVGGYHDGSVPEWTIKGDKPVVTGAPFDTVDIAYGNSHAGAKPEIKFETTMEGEVVPKVTGDLEIDTPTATRDVAGIRTETLELNGDVGFDNWNFLKPDWRVDGVDNIPRRNSIDWEAKNSRSIPIKNTALKAMYDIVDTKGIDPVMKAEAMRMITLSGKHLSEVAYSFRNIKGSKATKRTLGQYDPSTESIRVRNYKDIKNGSPKHTTLHEAMHALTYAKVEHGKLNPNTSHGKIVSEIDKLRTHIKDSLTSNPEYKKMLKEMSKEDRFAIDYSLTSTHELLSHLSEISAPRLKQWRELLDKMELPSNLKTDPFNPNGSTMLRALIDNLRKLLGLNVKEGNALAKALKLQDDLLQTPAMDIVMPNGSVESIILGSPKSMGKLMKTGIEEAKQNIKDAGSVMGAIGNKLAWNFYKTAHNINSKFADVFLNDPLGTNPGNIQQLKNGYRTDLIDKYRTVWEQQTLDELKNMGVKWSDFLFNPSKTREAHNKISKDVYEALIQIERGTYNPERMGLSKNLQDIVKTMDDFGKQTARLLVDKELLPPSILDGNGGYFPRRWDGHGILDTIRELEAYFPDAKDPYKSAMHYLGEQVGNSLRFKKFDADTRKLYGTALIQRAVNQADNVDLVFRGHMGNETAVFFRQELEKITTDTKAIQHIMDVVTGKIEDAGMERWQKGRMDLDMAHVMVMPDGSTLKVSDLLDTNNILQNMSRYLEDVAGKSAMADHGIRTTTDLHKWEQEFMRSATTGKGAMDVTKAGEMYEDVINNILGRPSGRTQHSVARVIGGLTQMMALRGSGFWQVTELAKAYARGVTTLGIGESTGMLFKAFGDFKAVKDPKVARQLDHILARKSFNEVRTRPYVDMFQDGFANTSSKMSAFEHAKGMVYHLNGMTTVQRFQSIYSAKVLTASLEEAVRGNAKLNQLFNRHGLSDSTQAKVRVELDKHGLDVDKWDAQVWSEVNPVMTSLMDTYVLRSSTGDVPYFFQFSEAGKILGTFQNFVLTSHNRIMANTMVNEGAKGFALLTAMQLPLAMLMTQVSSVSGGRGLIEDQGDWISASLGQMGSFGLIVELFNLITGNSNGIGGAFTISVDRTMDVFGRALQGDFGGALEAGAKSAPLLSLMPGWGLGIKTITDLGKEA